MPLIMQWNKRDLPNALPVGALERAVNKRKVKAFEATATTGDGVLETLRAITVEVFSVIKASMKDAGPTPRRAAAADPAGAKPVRRPNGAKKKARKAAARAPESIPLDDFSDDDPDTLKKKIAFAEFQNIAVMHHKLVERVSMLEKEVFRLRRDFKQAAGGRAPTAKKRAVKK